MGRYLIENLTRIPVDVDIASEYRYRKPIVEKGSVFMSITQSGETADTLAAQREAKRRGARTLTICNVVGSTSARENDAVFYTHAGPEIGVASTKAFTSSMFERIFSKSSSAGASTTTGSPCSMRAIGPCFISPAG